MKLLDELVDKSKSSGDGLAVLKSLIEEYKVKLSTQQFKSREQENQIKDLQDKLTQANLLVEKAQEI